MYLRNVPKQTSFKSLEKLVILKCIFVFNQQIRFAFMTKIIFMNFAKTSWKFSEYGACRFFESNKIRRTKASLSSTTPAIAIMWGKLCLK